MRSQLAAVAAEAAADQALLARLDSTIADDQVREERERAQLAVLARALYEQPDNPILSLAQAPSLHEAITRVSDLLSAAARARATRAALEQDMINQAAAEQRARETEQRLAAERQDLERQYQQLLIANATSTTGTAPEVVLLGSMADIIRQAWAPLGAGRADWAVRLAQCESGLNTYAVNSSSGAAGLFQFLPSTWASTPWRAQSPFDPSANALAAAWLYNRSGASQWQCSYRVGWS